MAGLELVTAPVKEPVSLAEIKDHLRVDGTDDDAGLYAYRTAARRMLESMTSRAWISQTWDWKLNAFPGNGAPLVLPLPPLQSVTSVTYIDEAGASQTWASSNYTVDTPDDERGSIHTNYNVTRPTTRDVVNAVTVRFVAGYGDDPADVPEPLRVALLMMVGHMYEHREPVAVGAGAAVSIPFTVEALVAEYRLHAF